MTKNYRRKLGAALAFCLLATASPAWSASTMLGTLSLDYDAAWQRGGADEELAEESIILRREWQQQPLEVFLPLDLARVQVSEARFLDQLQARWQARYGDSASFSTLDLGGTRWRVCRRPSLEGEATVFQLVTVRDGKAYLVVAMTPAAPETLPDPVRDLLARSGWSNEAAPAPRLAAVDESARASGMPAGAAPVPSTPAVPPSAPVTATPPVGATPPVQVTAAPPAPIVAMPPAPVVATPPAQVVTTPPAPAVPVQSALAGATPPDAVTGPELVASPDPAPPAPAVTVAPGVVDDEAEAGGRWLLRRVVVTLPGRKSLLALAEAERRRIPGDGLLSGVGLTGTETGLDWFLEGYTWVPGQKGGEIRGAFLRRWQLQWDLAKDDWRGGMPYPVRLTFAGEVPENQARGGFGATFRLAPACAVHAEVIRVLDDLEAGKEGAAGRLAAMAGGCREAGEPPEPIRVMVSAEERAAAGNRLTREVAIPLPADWEQRIMARAKGHVRRLVLETRFMASESGEDLGDALLAPAALYLVFVPDV